MNGYISDSSGCSSGTQGIPRKRRRVDTSKSSGLDNSANDLVSATEWETRNMKRELAVLRAKSSQAEATLQVKKQKEKLNEEEKEILEKQVESYAETIKQLMKDLNSQSKLSRVKMSMDKELEELRTENLLLKGKSVISTCGRRSTSSQKYLEIQRKMESAEQKIIDLKEQINLQKNELERAKVTIKELNAKVLSQEPLEEELRAAKVIISTLRADQEERYALEEQIHCLQTKLDQQRDVPVQIDHNTRSEVDDLQENDGEAGGRSDMAQIMIKVDPELLFHQVDSSNSITNDNSSPGTDGGEISLCRAPDEDKDEPLEEEAETQPQRDLRTLGGRYDSVCPTNPKFFEIDWDEEYERTSKLKWECMKCSMVLSAKVRMQDHVWGIHYGEEFQCSQCDYRVKWRSHVCDHVKKEHSGRGPKRGSKGGPPVLERFY